MDSTNITKKQGDASFTRMSLDAFTYIDNIEEIRIGVSVAEEEAKEESARRRINAPLTIEEKIFFSKQT